MNPQPITMHGPYLNPDSDGVTVIDMGEAYTVHLFVKSLSLSETYYIVIVTD